jgi:hypothetical protein
VCAAVRLRGSAGYGAVLRHGRKRRRGKAWLGVVRGSGVVGRGSAQLQRLVEERLRGRGQAHLDQAREVRRRSGDACRVRRGWSGDARLVRRRTPGRWSGDARLVRRGPAHLDHLEGQHAPGEGVCGLLKGDLSKAHLDHLVEGQHAVHHHAQRPPL